MRWFKHFTDSLDDPFIQELLDEFSHAGYVAFFGLIEIIAKENGHELTGSLEISPAYLKRKLRISQAKLKQIFGLCSTKGKLISDFSQEKWKFNFPKIAELKDNYTKDLQVTSKKPSKYKEVEVEVEVEVDNIKTKDYKKYGIFKNVKLTDEELTKLKTKFIDYTTRIEKLGEYMKSHGKKYKCHYATILTWSRKDEKEKGKFNNLHTKDYGETKGDGSIF